VSEILLEQKFHLLTSPHPAETLGSVGRSKVDLIHKPSNSRRTQLANQPFAKLSESSWL